VSDRWQAGILVVLLIATLTRVALVLTTHATLYGDPVDYYLHALSIAAGHGYPPTALASPGTPSAFRPPGYPYLLGGAFSIFGSRLVVGRLLGVVLGVLAVALMAYLGRAISDRRVGLIAGVLAALFLPFIALNQTLLSESLFLPLELGLALCLVRFRQVPAYRWALLAGCLCALAALTRGVADIWMIPTLVIIGKTRTSRRMRWWSLAGALVVFLVVLTPWTIRNAEAFHAFVPISTESGFTLAGQYNAVAGRDNAFQAVWQGPTVIAPIAGQVRRLLDRPGGINEVQLDGVLRSDGVKYLKAHPTHLITATVLDTLRMFDLGKGHTFTTGVAYRELSLPGGLWRPMTLSAQLIVLIAILSLVARVTRKLSFPIGPLSLWLLPILAYLLTVPSVGNPIKRLPLDPFFILLAALGASACWDAVGRRYRDART
jgi:4-amino-4-deoxy-L-arabinose transferase-like glycosyltransferase